MLESVTTERIDCMKPLPLAEHVTARQASYLTLKMLAAYSSCSVRWLRDRLSAGPRPLPHYRIEGKVLVRREEFDLWMTEHRTVRPADELSSLVETVVTQVRARRVA